MTRRAPELNRLLAQPGESGLFVVTLWALHRICYPFRLVYRVIASRQCKRYATPRPSCENRSADSPYRPASGIYLAALVTWPDAVETALATAGGRCMTTVVAVFSDDTEARRAIEVLRDHGFDPNDIGLITPNRTEHANAAETPGGDAEAGAAAGVISGGILGGLAGWLIGVGAFFIPGVGPVLAAGSLAAALVGATVGAGTGGLLGALWQVSVFRRRKPNTITRAYAEARHW